MGSLTVVSGLFEEFEEIRFQYVSTIKVGRHYAHHSPPLLYTFSEKLNSEQVSEKIRDSEQVSEKKSEIFCHCAIHNLRRKVLNVKIFECQLLFRASIAGDLFGKLAVNFVSELRI